MDYPGLVKNRLFFYGSELLVVVENSDLLRLLIVLLFVGSGEVALGKATEGHCCALYLEGGLLLFAC